MKIISRTMLGLSLPALLLATGSAYATARLQNVDSAMQASGKSTLRLHFDSKVSMPKSFIMKQPASIVLDFSNAATGMRVRSKSLNSRSVKNVKIASGAKKLRVMVSLKKLTKYTTSVQGNNIILTFEDRVNTAHRPRLANQHKSVKRQAVASNYVQRPHTSRYRPTNQRSTYRPAANRYGALLGAVDFRRTQNGGGRTIINLPSASTSVETRKVGNVVVLDIKNTKVKQPKKRIDVLDFATPASFVDIARKGKDVQVRILGNVGFTFTTERHGKQFIVNMKKVKRKVVVNPINKKKHYRGKKLSLNFQDIEVRSVLQLLADFTDKNIVVSDSVEGNITLRLKDVPWDQALDIVLESKGLAMRSNGNVIWVAPAAELVAKEQHELRM